MKKFTKAMQEDMASQMINKARDIDLCIFNALDGSMPNDFLLDCLMLYQANDGGFKSGLHIDNYNTNSSPFQVYEAFRMMEMVELDSKCDNELYAKIVNKACNYLFNRAEAKNGVWNPNVKSNNDFAHSKRFSYNEENEALFGLHPTLAILGYVLVYSDTKKAYYKKAQTVLDRLIPLTLEKENLTKYEAISLASLYRSLKKCGLYADKMGAIKSKIISNAKKNLSNEFENEDVLRPTDALLGVDTNEFDKELEEELDFIVSSVKSFGLWDHIGSWGYNTYPEEDSAMIKWIGAESVNNYYILKLYGRIE